ncbi:MAG: undecaprenyldiphospho-muramoylpentapeptide beta-N-acetylglucosaminyltransferase [Candidatus Adiutrix sp.]|jgi:UDP-N-acetylglucosamine--N-acetylmuramyl-(pentapeptide) pyrophosphoryl-undecaprenol N-acetylglucosamine transferase|nr:undecaprenyldiphospho-muramoylpentapeptide beta-N-acetylglucosaminyltransferase [Candidatus Adiutrix sp.]
MMENLRFMLAAGGTGGHLAPALALARALKKARPEADCLFVGSGRPVEAKMLDSSGFRRIVLRSSGWKGQGPLGRLKALGRALVAFWEALGLIRAYRPRICFGAGGYVTVPVGLAARILGVPLVVHEQNSRAGLSNRLLGRLADRVMLGFGEAAVAFPAAKTVVTGNPVRPEIAALGLGGRSFGPPPLTVLVTGGSQGARGLNLAAAPALAALGRGGPAVKIVHQAGAPDLEAVRAVYRQAGLAVEVEDFYQDMAALYRRVDLVVSRAGAITVTELAAAGLPAVLVPLPTAADDHQTVNARLLEAAGAAVVLPQSGLTPEALAEVLAGLLARPEKLAAMSRAAAKLVRPDADERMAAICLELAGAAGEPRERCGEGGR